MSEAKLSRAQRRHNERVSKEGKQTFDSLCEQFFRLMMSSNDPEGQQLDINRKIMNAKWRVYCEKMNFIPETYQAFDKWSKEVIEKYKKQKEDAA